MSSALITGISGFIGSNLGIRLVKNGWNITGTYRNPKRLHRISEVSDQISLVKDKHGGFPTIKRILIKKDLDVIFHFAAQTSHIFSLNNPLKDLFNNVHPIVELLNLIKDISEKKRPYIVFPSSKGVIGIPKYLPVDEKHPCIPEDPYSLNKWYCEHLLDLYSRKFGISSTALRLTNVYGPRQQITTFKKGFINYFIGLGLQNKEIEIFGEGKQKRDISYISDIIDAFELAGEKKLPDSNVIFLGTGVGVSIKNIAAYISELTGTSIIFKDFPPDFRKIEIGDFIVNNSEANRLLSWRPKTSWNKGLLKTTDFYRKYYDSYISEI
ncbi:MAG: GDP-mannose 4,6-dehydratase [Candidatus Hodarchaeota archaeon]